MVTRWLYEAADSAGSKITASPSTFAKFIAWTPASKYRQTSVSAHAVMAAVQLRRVALARMVRSSIPPWRGRRRASGRGAEALQRLGLVPLGETFSLGIRQQFVMVIGGCLVSQQRLKETMYVAGLKQVLAAGHQGDALKEVINGHSQMVAGWRIFSG